MFLLVGLCQRFVFVQGEGVAYRGRILVELSTKLEGKVDKMIETIPSDDLLVVQVQRRLGFLRRTLNISLFKKEQNVKLDLRRSLFSPLFQEVPAEEEILPVCSFSQRFHDPGTWRTNPV